MDTINLATRLSLGRRTLIRHLPYFLVAAKEENFHRAAVQLGLAQSALSRRILGLEHELGVLLFERLAHGVRLTSAGKMLYDDAQRILLDVEGAVDRISAHLRAEEGVIRIALTQDAARCEAIADCLRTFSKKHPKIRVNMCSMLTTEQHTALKNDAIDVGFMYEMPGNPAFDRTYEEVFFDKQEMLLAVYDGHRLASKVEITLEDLRHEDMVWCSRSRGGQISEGMVGAFEAASVTPKIILEVVTAEMTMNVVSSRLGIGLVPHSQAVPPGVVLRRIENFYFPLHLYAVWRKSNQLTALKKFAAVVMNIHEIANAPVPQNCVPIADHLVARRRKTRGV